MNDSVFFVSYARLDAEFEDYRAHLKSFIDALGAKVASKLGRSRQNIAFFDESSIEPGEVWRNELAEALQTLPVCLALYSPSYFTRPWCGKEFQIFLDRSAAVAGPGEKLSPRIVPVLWEKCMALPPAVAEIQYTNAALPREYSEVGLHQLQNLKIFSDQYALTLSGIADLIVAQFNKGLTAAAPLDLKAVRSAWDVATERDVNSHKEGGISKTCFVFAARKGWDWRPYPQQGKPIGAMAQQISGDLGLRYEELSCDGTLPTKLKETQASNVPTLIFGDPDSLKDDQYARPMRDYDMLYLLNCAALVPWSPPQQGGAQNDADWTYLQQRVFRQKAQIPPPNHEWRSIYSQDDLETRTRTTIENLRLRLLEKILGPGNAPAPGAAPGNAAAAGATESTVRKATDTNLAVSAANQGINVGSAAQLEAPSR